MSVRQLQGLLIRWRLVLSLLLILVPLILLSLYQYKPLRVVTPQLVTSLALDIPQPSPLTPNSSKSEYKQRFPQAIIIGVRKGGTRALLDMLNLHPAIVSAKAEVHYFDKDENFQQGVQWYIDRMPYTHPGQITIEKTPAYFVHEDIPQKIKSVSPSVKLLLIVRNPVDRTVSDFAQLNSKKRLSADSKHMSFEDTVFIGNGRRVNTNYFPITVSMYNVHFKHWLEYFDLSQILIVDGDLLITNPLPELQRAEAFLGLDSYFTEDIFYFNQTKGFYCWKRRNKMSEEVSHCLGSGKGREHPQLSPQAVDTLREFFMPHNKEFFKLSHKQFSW